MVLILSVNVELLVVFCVCVVNWDGCVGFFSVCVNMGKFRLVSNIIILFNIYKCFFCIECIYF